MYAGITTVSALSPNASFVHAFHLLTAFASGVGTAEVLTAVGCARFTDANQDCTALSHRLAAPSCNILAMFTFLLVLAFTLEK